MDFRNRFDNRRIVISICRDRKPTKNSNLNSRLISHYYRKWGVMMPTFIYHAMTLPSDIDGVPVCYFCYDAVDEDGQLLQRDCACRGTDAGFVHLACLMKYAETKSKQARDDMTEFVQPWETCPNCHQDYQNKLAVDIGPKAVSTRYA